METFGALIAVVIGVVVFVTWREQKERQERESLLRLNKAKKEEVALKKELTKVTEEINLAEIDYKKRMEEYDKKYGRKSTDSPE